jgi:peptidoglycan/xylan/chitin deacetylase (PgdA/CDA1 family)/folate-dependent phosphoribosylglycinamide formyltransferase PurN
MRIVATTGTDLRHRLFVAMLEETVGGELAGVLFQKRKPQPPPSGLAAAQTRVRARVARRHFPLERLWRPATASAEDHLVRLAEPLVAVDRATLASRMAVHEDVDPNSPASLSWLRETEPDLVLIFGGKLLRSDWLTAPRLGALNVHYGVLPAYRGGSSTEFALYHERADLVGATVHYIDAGVDTGPIVRRAHVDPREGGSLEECKAQVYMSGLKALVACADETRRSGDRLPEEVPSPKLPGYRARDFNTTVEVVARIRAGAAPFPSFHRRLVAAPRRRRIRGRLPAGPLPAGFYVFLYHSIVDPTRARPWERAYDKVAADATRFEAQLRFMCRHMTHVPLEQAFELFRTGPPDRPCFAITFDDGYTNLLTTALPICERLGVRPTVFANAAFASGREVYYRVLLVELLRRGKVEETAVAFRERFPDRDFHAGNLWSLSKDAYVVGETEAATLDAWRKAVGGDDGGGLDAHLSFDQLQRLRGAGWSVGNHTLSHVPLTGLTRTQLDAQILENQRELAAEGLEPIDWLSYPFGRPDHTDEELGRFMDDHPELMGIYANGGVNLAPSRREWARIGLADETPAQLRTKLIVETAATVAAWAALAGE